MYLDEESYEDFFLKLPPESAFNYLSKALASLNESHIILEDDLTFIEIFLK
jgi:hypothetical protein